jgi:thiol-disulfide isomerase/thioredoxin
MFKNLRRAALTLLFALTLAQAAGAQTNSQPAKQAATQTPAQTPAQPATQTAAQANEGTGHEYAPILEQKLDYKDWTFKSLKDGSPASLRELAKDKKLVMVVYFAPWCGNWKAEAPVALRLYDKYKAQGFEIVGVSEYGAAADTRTFFDGRGGAPFPVVVESEAGDAREKTTHFGYRKAAGDARRWGSPFNVFLEPAKLNKTGDVLTEKAWVVGGELIEKDAEQFIRERLGLTAQAAAEQCKDEPKAEVKKQ